MRLIFRGVGRNEKSGSHYLVNEIDFNIYYYMHWVYAYHTYNNSLLYKTMLRFLVITCHARVLVPDYFPAVSRWSTIVNNKDEFLNVDLSSVTHERPNACTAVHLDSRQSLPPFTDGLPCQYMDKKN